MTVDFVGIGEAAQILGLSRTSVQKLVDSGQLPAVKTTGGHRRILRSSIEALNQKMGPKAMLRLASASAPASAVPGSQAASVPRGQQLQVLVVEDDAASAAVLVGTFEDEYPGVRVLVASDGLDAVLQLERVRPNIVITDLNMQPFDGFRLISMVSSRSEYSGVAIVVVSGMSDAEIQKHGGLPPNVVFMRKPLNMDRMKGFIDAHVQLHAQLVPT
ncbi:MAG: helix-turn-helix domain-containing protein [Pseudomonadota bacterium]